MKRERFNEERLRVAAHRDEVDYIDEAFGELPREELEFIKRYVAEA